MPVDIGGLRAIAAKRDRYSGQLDRLRKIGKETKSVESAVSSACDTLRSGTTSFVIYGEPQSGKTEMMICLTAKLLDEGHRIIIHLLNDSVQLLQQNLDRFQRANLSPAAKNFSDVVDPDYSLATGFHVIFCKKNSSDLMRGAVSEAARVLSSNGRAIYVVGENTVSGTFIPNAKIVAAVADLAGLKTDSRRARHLPANRRYLPPPTARNAPDALGARMRREVILSFSK